MRHVSVVYSFSKPGKTTMSQDNPELSTAETLAREGFVVLRNIIKEPQVSQYYRYVLKLKDAGLLARGDDTFASTPCGSGEFMLDGLLISLLPEVELASGLQLFPTYTYFRVYEHGDVLNKHTDRHACEVSVSVFLGATSDVDWPLWIEGYQSTRAVALSPGDGVLYRGIECAHWREAFNGQDHAQLFQHYVDRNGPYAGFKFDQLRWDFPFSINVETGSGDSTT